MARCRLIGVATVVVLALMVTGTSADLFYMGSHLAQEDYPNMVDMFGLTDYSWNLCEWSSRRTVSDLINMVFWFSSDTPITFGEATFEVQVGPFTCVHPSPPVELYTDTEWELLCSEFFDANGTTVPPAAVMLGLARENLANPTFPGRPAVIQVPVTISHVAYNSSAADAFALIEVMGPDLEVEAVTTQVGSFGRARHFRLSVSPSLYGPYFADSITWDQTCWFPYVGGVRALADYSAPGLQDPFVLQFWSMENVGSVHLRVDFGYDVGAADPTKLVDFTVSTINGPPPANQVECLDISSQDFSEFGGVNAYECFGWEINDVDLFDDDELLGSLLNGRMYRGYPSAPAYETLVYNEPYTNYRSNYLDRARSCCKPCSFPAASGATVGDSGVANFTCPPMYYDADGTGCCRPLRSFIRIPFTEDGEEFYATSCPEMTHPEPVGGWGVADVYADDWECVPCPDGMYAPRNNRYISCVECPAFFDCRNGSALYELGETPSWCTTGDLENPGDNLEDWVDRYDVWAEVQAEPDVFTCPWAVACPLGEGSCDACLPGYSGQRCGECSPGYYHFQDECVQCPDNPGSIAFIVVGVIILIILVLGFAASRNPKDSSPLISLGLISVTHVQVLTVYFSFDVEWPPIFSGFIKRFAVFSLDLDLITLGPTCVSATDDFNNPLTKVIVYSLGLPVIAIAFVAIARLMKCFCRCHCFEKVVSFEMRFFFLLFNFSYIFIVARTLEVFDCEALPPRIVAAAVNGTSAPDGSMSMVEEDTIHVLGAYPSIQCGSSEWVPIVVVGAIGFTLWGLCVPGFLCVRLFRRRSRFDEPEVKDRYGVFFKKYKEAAYYFEFINLLKKVALVAISTLIATSSSYQLVLSLIMLAAFNIYFWVKRPYADQLINLQESMLGVIDMLVLLSGFAFQRVLNPNNLSQVNVTNGLDIALIVLVLLSGVVIVVIAILLVVKKGKRICYPEELLEEDGEIDDLKVIGEDGKASESTGGGEKKPGATPTVVEPSSVPGGLSPDVFAAANANESEMLGVGADTRDRAMSMDVMHDAVSASSSVPSTTGDESSDIDGANDSDPSARV